MRRRPGQPLTDLPNEEGDCRPRGEWTQVAVAVHCRGPEWLHSLPSPWFRRPQDRLGLKPPQPQARLRSTFFSPLQPSTSAGAPTSDHTQHTQRQCSQHPTLAHFTAPPAPRNCSFLFAAKRPVAGHLISPPVPLLGHRHGRCHEGQSSRELLRSRPLSQASPRLQVAFPDSLQANIGTS